MARNKFTKEEHLDKMSQARIESVQPIGGLAGGNPDIQRLMAAAQKRRAELGGQSEGGI